MQGRSASRRESYLGYVGAAHRRRRVKGEGRSTFRRLALPSWLDGQTIVLFGGLIALWAVLHNGFSSVRQDMEDIRAEIRAERALRKEEKAEPHVCLPQQPCRAGVVDAAVGGNVRLDSLEQVVDGVRGLVEGADLRPSASQGGRVAQGP